MIGLGSSALKVYVALEAFDMRMGFNGLAAAVTGAFGQELAPDSIFAFTNKRRTRVKLLCFDGTGIWLATKRLEAGTFSWPAPADPGQRKIRLAPEALRLLLDGVDMRGARFRPWYQRES
jgi:transposase